MSSMQLSLFEKSVLEGVASTGTTSGCYEYVAKNVGLTASDMREQVFRGEKTGYVGKWQHKIRTVQQKLKYFGLVEKSSGRGAWKITNKGRHELTYCPAGGAKMYFTTQNGMAFWADSADVVGLFEGEVDLIITSPPYLLSRSRDYGDIGKDEHTYVDNLVRAIESWLPMLTSTASIVLNIGNSIKAGEGYQNLHKERLLIQLEDKLNLHLVQKFTWFSPDCVDSTEDFLWLSLSPKDCKADNRNVLVEYSDMQRKYMQSAERKTGTRTPPSGHYVSEETFYRDQGGAIPSTLLLATPEGARSPYSQYCRENDLPRHPAMYSWNLPEFFIKYLTERGDVVFDPFSGSGNTAYAGELNDRYWISSEITKQYVEGHYGRFISNGLSATKVA
jgi:site-specific DNA-methyltransferase (cytosine-N4-specific)